MKKLTWALWSLMLLLCTGVAFAQDDEGGGNESSVTVPSPVLSPEDGSTVTPKGKITPLGTEACLELLMQGKFVYVMYVWDDATTELTAIEDLNQTMAGEGEAAYSVDMWYPNDDVDGGDWMSSVVAPEEKGSHTLRVRLVATPSPYAGASEQAEDGDFDDAGYIYGAEISANYTVEGEAVAETVDAPTLSPASSAVALNGRVNITSTYGENPQYPVYYVIDNPDFDFTAIEHMEGITEDMVHDMNGWVQITKPMSIKVAICKINMDGSIAAWSDPVSGTYTIAQPVAPVFNPDGGEVALDDPIELTTTSQEGAKIYYQRDDESTAFADFTTITTKSALDRAIGNTLAEYNSDNKITLEELGAEEADEELSVAAATAWVDAADNVIWSEVITKKFTIKAAITMPTPTISVESGVVVAGTEVLFNYKGGDDAGDLDYEIYYVEDADFDFAKYTTYEAVEEAGAVYGDSYNVTEDVTIKVAVALVDYDNDGKIIAWSEPATATYTIGTPSSIPTPIFMPATGSTVAPGDMISFTIPKGFETIAENGAFVFYVFDDDEMTLETTFMELMADKDNNFANMPFKVGMYANREWRLPVTIPANAQQGETHLRARMAMLVEDPNASADDEEAMPVFIYSEEVTPTYTVEGEIVTEPVPVPTFDLEDGAAVAFGTTLHIDFDGKASTNPAIQYNVYWVLDDADFDFTQYTDESEVEEAGATYFESLKLVKATAIKAATAKIDYTTGGQITWSEPVSASYTVGAPQKPTFDPASDEVVSGTKVAIKSADNPTSGKAIVDIYYTTDGTMPTAANTKYTEPIEITGAVTIKAIAVGIADNTLVSEPAEASYTVKATPVTVAQPVITPQNAAIKLNQKVTITCATTDASIYYTLDGTAPDNTKTLYEAPFLLPDNTQVGKEISIRAIAFLNGVYSDPARSNCMVEAAGEGPDDPTPPTPVTKPDAPKFEVNGTEVTAATLEVSATPAQVKWIGEANDNYTVVYTLDGSEAVFAVTNMYDFDDDANYWQFGGEAIDVKVPATIKARVAATDNMGAITWSDMTTLALTLAAAPADKPATPTFDPEAGEVPVGTVVYIDCATIGATVHYTIDGSMPTAESEIADFMTEIEITEDMTIKAIAIKDGVSSDVAVGEYTVVEAGPIHAEVSISSFMLNDNTVGKNAPTGLTISDPENPESQMWLYTSPAVIYYTVDGTTVPSKDAYEAQTDKENGAIKMVATEEDEEYGGNATDSYGNVMSITISEATHLQAIGYLTMGDEEVVTPVFEKDLEVKALDNPEFSISNYKKVASGDKLVIKNPAPAQADDDEEGELKAKEGEEETAAPVGTLYFSFDGTLPTRNAYDAQKPDYEGIDWSDPESVAAADPYRAYKIFKSEPDIEITFGQDENGFYAYVPAIGEFTTNMGHKYDTIRLDEDGFFDVTVWCEGAEEVGMNPLTGWPNYFIFGSDFVTHHYTMNEDFPTVTLTFNPASGSEVEENTAVTINASDASVEIFYMMFESEAAAKAAEWNQEEALSYSGELQPVLTPEKNTIKAAYAYEGSDIVEATFFYATYKVKALPAIELTFNPASGSEVENNTTVTVTANREVEIYYNLYADKAAADADTTFMGKAKEVEEDGMPVITKGNTYLRCAVTDRGEMKYFDATYTIKVANEGEEELAGVSVYPNPSNGLFNLELPVAATVEVFASNGVLVQRMKLGEGSATLNIERSGIYFLRITGEGRTVIKRVIVR